MAEKLTSTSLIMGSAASPTVLRHRPKNSEKVMMPRMFMLTAAAATLSGNMLRATSSSASRGVRCTAAGRSAGVGAATCRYAQSHLSHAQIGLCLVPSLCAMALHSVSWGRGSSLHIYTVSSLSCKDGSLLDPFTCLHWQRMRSGWTAGLGAVAA